MEVKKTKILITGIAGFIGSSFLESFFTRGIIDKFDIVGVDDFSNGKIENIDDYLGYISFYESKVDDYLETTEEKFDYIFNFAAHNSIPKNESNPKLTLDSIDSAQSCMGYVPSNPDVIVIHASSSSIYGNPYQRNIIRHENTTYSLTNNYAKSKRLIECQFDMLKAFGVKFIGLRFFNVYGPKQRKDTKYTGVIAKWINDIKTNRQIGIIGDGETKRCFTYIDDVVEILHRCFDNKKAIGEFINVANAKEVSLNEIASILQKEIGPFEIIGYNPNDNIVKTCPASIAKMQEMFNGYVAKVEIEDGIRRILEHDNEK